MIRWQAGGLEGCGRVVPSRISLMYDSMRAFLSVHKSPSSTIKARAGGGRPYRIEPELKARKGVGARGPGPVDLAYGGAIILAKGIIGFLMYA